MTVELLHSTPLWIASRAIRTCWDSHDKSDTDMNPWCDMGSGLCYPIECGQEDKKLINRIGNKMKHESVKNHITYNFEISGITTKTLLALTRHDVGVEFSVQSTRYTTKKSVKSGEAGYTESKSDLVNSYLHELENMIKHCVAEDVANDEISLLLPQAWKYNLVCSMSMSAVQHFLRLRTKKDAHWDIQELAHKMYEALPEDHLYLFDEYINIGGRE